MKRSIWAAFVRVYSSPVSIATFVVGIVAYYYLFTYINAASFFMLTVPIYLVYVLIATSALLLAAGIYSLSRAFASAKFAAGGAPFSALTSVFGSMMSCGCHYSLLVAFLASIGASAGEVAAIERFDLFYGNYLVALFIAINAVLLLLMLRRLRQAC